MLPPNVSLCRLYSSADLLQLLGGCTEAPSMVFRLAYSTASVIDSICSTPEGGIETDTDIMSFQLALPTAEFHLVQYLHRTCHDYIAGS